MKVAFLTFEQFHKRKNIGSSKIRAKWLINHWDEAELYTMGQKYDAIIFQKVYWIEFAKEYEGIKILDLCDPDWMHWGHRVKEMLDLCDAATCNTEITAQFIKSLVPDEYPVYVIPDSIDMQSLPEPKTQGDNPTRRVGWYGYDHNFRMVDEAMNALIKLGIEEIVIIANKPYSLQSDKVGKIELINYPYSEDTVYRDIQSCDVIINPQLSSGRWKFKSNNKTILAQALGVPVAHTDRELEKLMEAQQRIDNIHDVRPIIIDQYDVRKRVDELKNIIKDTGYASDTSDNR